MKLLSLTIAAALFAVSAAWADTFFVKQTSDGFLNVRSGPGTQFAILREIYPGDQVTSIERKGRWHRVKLPGGGTGWVSGNFLQEVVSWSGDIRVVLRTSDGFLNMRTGPGTGNAVIRRIYPGDQVQVLGQSGNWLRVRLQNGRKGWVHGAYVK